MKRKHISWKTKCAAALLDAQIARGLDTSWYVDAKQMTEDQFLSLFQWDHNIFHSGTRSVASHESGLIFTPLDPDVFWNLTPMLIKAHREKTKVDVKIIAKGKRIRKDWHKLVELSGMTREPPLLRRLRSRGFDKTKRRKWDGTVVKR
jgi:hypothetical protein